MNSFYTVKVEIIILFLKKAKFQHFNFNLLSKFQNFLTFLVSRFYIETYSLFLQPNEME